MQVRRARNALPQSPRPSGRSALVETFTRRMLLAVGPATATVSMSSLSDLARMMLVELNRPPFAAASHTSSNSSARDVARTIASLVVLSAPSMRASRSFWASAFAFSLARSKFSSANETFSAIRAISATTSSSSAHDLPTKNISTPTLCPDLISGTATQAVTPVSRAVCCQGRPCAELRISWLTQGFCVRNARPQTPFP